MKNKIKVATIKLPDEKGRQATSIQDYILMFYGPPGVGKTTFVNELNDRVLFLSTDRGTRFISAMRVEVNSFNDVNKVLKALEADPGKYSIICIDHVDDLANMIEDHVCNKLGIESLGDAGYGKGWKAYRKGIHSVVQRLLRLGMGVVFIAHESIKTVRTRSIETERTMPALSKSAWQVIVPMADLVGYCGFKKVKGKEGKRTEVRVLETQPREDLYAKDRIQVRHKPEGHEWEHLSGKDFLATFSKRKRTV